MDYGKVLSRAWEITWRWKILWLLGFLAALGNAASTGGSSSSYTTDSSQWNGYRAPIIPGEIWALIAALACVGLFIAIALWVVSTIARGGLIAGVQQVEDEDSTSFGRAWRAGASRFWTLVGIGVLTVLLPLVVFLLGAFGTFVVVASTVGITGGSKGAIAAPIILAITCSGVLCCGLVILSVILAQIRIYAERAAVLEGLGWIDAFKRGWQVLKDNLGPTIIYWLIFLVIGLAVGAVIVFVLFLSLFPLFMILAATELEWLIVGSVCCLGPVAIIVAALVGAIIQTFSSATWTLAYREMTSMPDPDAVEPVVEAIEEGVDDADENSDADADSSDKDDIDETTED
jgi:hypothetical protein